MDDFSTCVSQCHTSSAVVRCVSNENFFWTLVFIKVVIVLAIFLEEDCAFMNVSALLCANSCDILTWKTETIDGILIEGDAMDLKAFEERSVPEEETISLNYLFFNDSNSHGRTIKR